MECPKCKFNNPEGIKYCGQCGNKLEKMCPQCGFANLPTFKFCGECGHDLILSIEPIPKDLTYDEKISKIQRYLPEGLTEKILTQREKIEGERKQVTVMFCDMKGFTSLTETLGPEETYAVMDQIYGILIHKVHDYEGTVNEMTGDGIMALFGAPIALEDAPQRAIRSALAIHREMARFNDRLKKERNNMPPIRMRIGIHSGPVVVGTLGNDLRVEFKAVGDTVNLASRMENLAESGTTYVTDATFRLTEGYFRYEFLGEKDIKGLEEPVKVYRAIAPSLRQTRFDVSAERGLTTFVGRHRELEILFDAFERFREGRGQAVSIISEAGVGKSRLLYEFRKAVTNEDITFLEGKCLSYSRAFAYHPMIDLLKSNFDINERDGDHEIRGKVMEGLKLLKVDETSTLPYLLELLSVKDSGIDKIPMSPEARKDRIIDSLKKITIKGSEIRPLIVAIEDLHWIDKSSEDTLKYLLESISGARTLLIFTYRPEFVHTWGGRSYHSQVNLSRLSNRESLTMVSHLLGTEHIEMALEDLILEKTEGIPFYIEEFIRSLKDLKVIERKDNTYHLVQDIQAVTIPSTIQDIIMARVDSLPEVSKEVLQTGSVIEREFSYEVIKQLTGLPEQQLLSHLSVLKDSELLYERGVYPQSTYIFKNALTREVIYDSILAKKKKKLHEEIGRVIEDVFRENIDEHYGMLTEHFIESENYEKGAKYSELAGKKAITTASIYDAIAYAKKCVACLEKLPQTLEAQKKMIDMRTALGLYYLQYNYNIEAKETVAPIVELALKRNYKKRISQIYTLLGTHSFTVEGDYSKGLKYFEDALIIAEELHDVISVFMATYWLGFGLSFWCEYEKSLYYLNKALEINLNVNRLWGISVLKSIIGTVVYNHQGNVTEGYKTSEEAIQTAEESGDIYSKALAYTSHGVSYYYKGNLREAMEHLMKGIDFCRSISFFTYTAYAEFNLSEVYFELGQYQKARDHYNKAALLFEKSGFIPSLKNLAKIGTIRAEIMINEKDVDLESIYSWAFENKYKMLQGWTERYIAEILLNLDDTYISEAENWILRAIKTDKTNGMNWHLGQDYLLYGELSKRKGDRTEARARFNQAIETFRECGADGWIKKTEQELPTFER
jgi:class 3 adenylate cyclase/tetratricopeptide (TPR) repeat protein